MVQQVGVKAGLGRTLLDVWSAAAVNTQNAVLRARSFDTHCLALQVNSIALHVGLDEFSR